MRLSVIIVNYNVKYFLEQCLHSVIRACNNISAEVIVIDNDSPDGSIEYLKPLFPQVIFIGSAVNLGFGKANNLAVQQSKGELVLFLNPDTLVPEDCFQQCITFIDQHPQAAALGIKMIDGSGRFLPESKRSFPTTVTAFYKLTGLAALFPRSRHFNKYSLGYLNKNNNHRVDVLAGAFMMVRRKVLDITGGFDEQFFMYGEDIDLSYRFKKAGWENWYFAGSCILHFKGESSKKGSLNYIRMFYKAMIVFVHKHYQGRGAAALKLFLVTAIRARAAVSFFQHLKPGIQKPRYVKNTITTVIAGNETEYLECREICHKAAKENNLPGWVELQDNGNSSAAAILNQLKQYSAGQNIPRIIFCTGSLSYSRVLNIMQELGPGYRYLFHHSGSKSIVGSYSKNQSGDVIVYE